MYIYLFNKILNKKNLNGYIGYRNTSDGIDELLPVQMHVTLLEVNFE